MRKIPHKPMVIMYYPDKKEFLKLAKKGNLIPVYREILADFETPLSAFKKIEDGPYSFLLESVEGGERIARYSFLGSSPSMVISSRGSTIEIIKDGKKDTYAAKDDPIEELKEIISGYRPVRVKGLPRFSGGLVGFLGYDMVRFMEEIPDNNPDDLGLPESCFMLCDTLLVFDHVDHKIKVVSNAFTGKDPAKSYREAIKKIDSIIAKLLAPNRFKRGTKRAGAKKVRIESNMTKVRYKKMVERAKEHIRSGDIIQVVPSQRLAADITVPSFEIYRALRSVNPSPYMYYLNFDAFSLVGSSPEIMVRCEDGRVEVRPIAGTRRRGASEEEDEKLIKDLLKDPKERAEHIMLVDLGRNDLGRVSELGSVKISELMAVEKYSHVMHIVSDVEGRLAKGKDSFDVIRATFPAGTVSGAPKIRAMEIIDELETVRRGPYAGAVAYFSFSGNLDACITIRTILVKGKRAYIQAGGGVVADSDPENEYIETLNKAKALVRAIELAENGLE